MLATPLLCRPFRIFERCLDSNSESCPNRRATTLTTHLPYLATHLPVYLKKGRNIAWSHFVAKRRYDSGTNKFFKLLNKLQYPKLVIADKVDINIQNKKLSPLIGFLVRGNTEAGRLPFRVCRVCVLHTNSEKNVTKITNIFSFLVSLFVLGTSNHKEWQILTLQ